MNFLNLISVFISKFMGIIVLFVAGIALFFPHSVSFIESSYINYLLMIVMFSMGLTLSLEDFKLILKRPRDIFIGTLVQFIIMPLVAFLLCYLFKLPSELAFGAILVGVCPGGTASNVMTYLAKGDLALSISLTAVSTLLSPFLTPLLALLYAGHLVKIDWFSMFLSIAQIVIVPIFLGILINNFFYNFIQKIKKILPLISVVAIVAIVACVVGLNSKTLLQTGYTILLVVMLHNLLGYFLGYKIAKIFRMEFNKCKAISIEVGMQNSALAISLASSFNPSAAITGAIFSVWQNISGSIIANFFARKK